jgi:hypothetical protein
VRESQVAQYPRHRQHPHPLHAQGLEVRPRIALQGRCLFRQHPPFHRQQMGHRQSHHDARR